MWALRLGCYYIYCLLSTIKFTVSCLVLGYSLTTQIWYVQLSLRVHTLIVLKDPWGGPGGGPKLPTKSYNGLVLCTWKTILPLYFILFFQLEMTSWRGILESSLGQKGFMEALLPGGVQLGCFSELPFPSSIKDRKGQKEWTHKGEDKEGGKGRKKKIIFFQYLRYLWLSL